MGTGRKISINYVCSEGCSLIHVPSGNGGGQEDVSHVRSGRCSLIQVLSGDGGRRGGSQPYMQWQMLSDTCLQWGERRGGSVPCTH